MNLPKGTLVMIVKRGDEFLIPNGTLKLHEGDKLLLISEKSKEEDETAKKYLVVLDGRIKDLFQQSIDEMNQIYSVSKKLNETYDAQKYVVVFGKNAAVYGFAEDKDAEKIKNEFETIEDVHVESKPAMGDSRLTPPTKLKNNWFSRPFRMFVEMYGVPSYTDFDPTNLVAISYTFLFGMM